MPTYFVNEFRIESAVPLPAESECEPVGERDCITFRRASLADLPCTLRKLRRQLVYDMGDGFLVEPHRNVAIHVDFRGQTITLDASDERLPVAAAWALHAGLGAATLAHGGLPLHGAGLEVEGRYVALVADSGVGKSTLSWHLMQNGFRFGSDDLVPVRVSGEGVTAYPSVSLYPRLKREAAEEYGLKPHDLLPADYGTAEEGYFLPIPREHRVVEPQRLTAIFLLQPVFSSAPDANECGTGTCENDNSTDHAAISHRLEETAAAQILLRNLHTAWMIGKWLDQKSLLKLCSQVAAGVPVYVLRYERSFAALPRLARLVRDLA